MKSNIILENGDRIEVTQNDTFGNDIQETRIKLAGVSIILSSEQARELSLKLENELFDPSETTTGLQSKVAELEAEIDRLRGWRAVS